MTISMTKLTERLRVDGCADYPPDAIAHCEHSHACGLGYRRQPWQGPRLPSGIHGASAGEPTTK